MSETQKKPMCASDYVKNQPHLQGKQITTGNQFSALAEFPPLSYAKAVNPQPQKLSTPSSSQKTSDQKSSYFLKPQRQHLITTSFTKPISLKDLTQYTNCIFYEDSQYLTDNLTKNRTFYEFILVDTKSVEITHHTDKNNPNLISYSTCKILKICNPQDLGFINLHTSKDFSIPGYHIPRFTYIDYQKAFLHTFYLRTYDHSWFLSFDFHCPKTIPGWFYEWWYWFGPSDDIYPPQIPKVSIPYYTKHEKHQLIGPLPKIAFHIDMGIPWILSWHYNLIPFLPDMPYSLVREFRIKWWDKYNMERCSLTNLEKWIQTHQQIKQTVAAVSRTLPPIQTKTSPKKPPSPTESTTSSSGSKKSKGKEKLKKLLESIAMQISSSDDEDDITQDNNTQHNDPYGGPLSQDPF